MAFPGFQLDLFLLTILVVGLATLVYIFRKQNQQLRIKVNFQNKRITDLNHTHETIIKNYLQSTFEIQEAERKRIAANLHDEIGANLNTIKINLEALARLSLDNANVKLHAEILKIIDETVKRCKEIVWDISPAHIDQFGLVKSVDQMCKRINFSYTLKVDFTLQGDVPNQLDKRWELNVYRMVQELLNNSVKYSNAWNTRLSFLFERSRLVVDVIDNGVGVANYNPVPGSGMINVESRLSLLGGTMKVRMDKHGTDIRLKIPYSYE